MAILDYDAQIWRDALDLPRGAEPIVCAGKSVSTNLEKVNRAEHHLQ